MRDLLRKLLQALKTASEEHTVKCEACGTVMRGNPNQCERCGADLIAGRN